MTIITKTTMNVSSLVLTMWRTVALFGFIFWISSLVYIISDGGSHSVYDAVTTLDYCCFFLIGVMWCATLTLNDKNNINNTYYHHALVVCITLFALNLYIISQFSFCLPGDQILNHSRYMTRISLISSLMVIVFGSSMIPLIYIVIKKF